LSLRTALESHLHMPRPVYGVPQRGSCKWLFLLFATKLGGITHPFMRF